MLFKMDDQKILATNIVEVNIQRLQYNTLNWKVTANFMIITI